jgi:hypothetical protein
MRPQIYNFSASSPILKNWPLSARRCCYNQAQVSSKFSKLHSTFISYTKLNLFFLFVCLFVPYTKSHFWTNLNQTLHTSPPWSGRDRRVCMDPRRLTFSTFLIYFVASECRFHDRRWLPAQESSALYPWFLQVLVIRHGNDVADDSFAFLPGVCCTLGNAYKTRRSERKVCV